jgi:heme oxygenase (mycobilin-producing)
VLVVSAFVVNDEITFTRAAHAALAAFAARPGYVRGQLGRAYDEPGRWSLVTEWESVGTYRRALSAFEVKVTATPLMAAATDAPSAYETLAVAEPGGAVETVSSDRAETTSSRLRSSP